MAALPAAPTIYEINSWAWIDELCRRYGRPITLATVPAAEWDAIAAWGVDAVWLMGVWERSAAGIAIVQQDAALMGEFRRVVPDFRPEDLVGSPYCVRGYACDGRLGGPEGLAVARAELRRRGMGLLLDFVPNHVAPDHRWAEEHPSYFIQGDAADLERAPHEFIRVGYSVLARGRDPYFAPWSDVVQLNAFDPGLRAAMIAELKAIAEQCDGVRCDMAMLVMNDIFAQTWGERAGDPPIAEYWDEVIGAVRAAHPDFIWIAEAYWDREYALQQLGFDYCYDKRLYDRLLHDGPAEVDGHLHADLAYQQRLVRFIENHDEQRAATAFTPAKHRVAAVTAATQAGARLFHEGQFEGRRVRLPVFLGRRPDEAPDRELQLFYRRLLGALRHEPLRAGSWRRCDLAGWEDNRSAANLVAWAWVAASSWALVVVNLSDAPAQALVLLDWEGLAERSWSLVDLLDDARYRREGDRLAADGLYVELQAWGVHLLVTEP
jgi:hypothetical protein